MYRKNIILLLIVLTVGILSGYSLNEFHYGYKLNTFDATAVSLGNTGTAGSSNPFGITLNAINTLNQAGEFGFETSINSAKVEDKRSIPMYNSFNSYINESTYTAQENINYNLGVAITYNYKFEDKKSRVGFGLYTAPKYSFIGDYNEEVRNNDNSNDDNYPAKIAVNKIKNKGSLMAYGAALAYQHSFDNMKYLKNLAIGVNLELLDGNAKSTKSIRFTDWAHNRAGYGILPDYEEVYDRDLSGFATQFSINYEVNHRTTLAFVFNPKVTIDVDATSRLNTIKTYADSIVVEPLAVVGADLLKKDIMLADYDLPSAYKLALQFKPRNILKTTFNVEAELVRWSETNKLFEDKFNYYLGVEHKIIETVPVRMGFSSTHSYDIAYDDEFSYAVELMTPTVALGTGFEFSNRLRADLGFTYAFRKYETLDLFMDEYYDYPALWPNTHINLKNRDWSNPDTVKENTFDFMFSLTLDL